VQDGKSVLATVYGSGLVHGMLFTLDLLESTVAVGACKSSRMLFMSIFVVVGQDGRSRRSTDIGGADWQQMKMLVVHVA
jgi:hypothetical protein